jgi:hypothetical protein
MPRRSFFAALAIAAIALGTAVLVRAQAPGTRIVGEQLVVSGGHLFQIEPDGWVLIPTPMPADQIAEAWAPSRGDLVTVIDVNGNGWGYGNSWTNFGPAPWGATAALKQSWGQLNARYR